MTLSTWIFQSDNILEIIQEASLQMNQQLLINLNQAQVCRYISLSPFFLCIEGFFKELTCPEEPPLTKELGTHIMKWRGRYSSADACLLVTSPCPWTCEEMWVHTEKFCDESVIVPLHHHVCNSHPKGSEEGEAAMNVNTPCTTLILNEGQGEAEMVLQKRLRPQKETFLQKEAKYFAILLFALVTIFLVAIVWRIRRNTVVVV